jgi:hypothetical protein
VSSEEESDCSFVFLHVTILISLTYKYNDSYLFDKLEFMIDRVEEVNGKEIKVSQDLSLSHAGTVWDGAIVMAYFFNKNKHIPEGLFNGKRVL